MKKTALTNDVGLNKARSVFLAYKRGVSFRQLEVDFALHPASGMTAFRVVRKYKMYLRFKNKTTPTSASQRAGFLVGSN